MSRVTFNNTSSPFYDQLRKEVSAYFSQRGTPMWGDFRLYLKSWILISSSLILYIWLVFYTPVPLFSIPLALLFGLNLTLIGFNVMHDACHGSYSSSKIINEIMGYSMNYLGSNMFFWKIKHNIIHHTYTNIDEVDDDIIKPSVLRLCPTQPYYKYQKYQHIYSFFLYIISGVYWVLYSDFVKYFSGKISGTPVRNISLKEHIIFWVSKIYYVVVFIVIPIMQLGWMDFIIGYLLVNAMFGISLSVVFQLAHVVETTHFDSLQGEYTKIDREWGVHQVMTTADFATDSKVLTWLLGGLNFQTIHHLFPRISHIHYPEIQPIIKKVCDAHQVRYNEFPTFSAALNSHIRFLKFLGNGNNINI